MASLAPAGAGRTLLSRVYIPGSWSSVRFPCLASALSAKRATRAGSERGPLGIAGEWGDRQRKGP